MSGRPINESRQLALITGERTYVGAEHKCGTTERYVKGGGCVHCARQLQAEQRSARLAMLEGSAPIPVKPKPAPKPATDVLSVVARRVAAKRETFEVPPGHVAVRDAEGRATGEVIPVNDTPDDLLQWPHSGLPAEPAPATAPESYPNPWD